LDAAPKAVTIAEASDYRLPQSKLVEQTKSATQNEKKRSWLWRGCGRFETISSEWASIGASRLKEPNGRGPLTRDATL
jgi:hypothetical protein